MPLGKVYRRLLGSRGLNKSYVAKDQRAEWGASPKRKGSPVLRIIF